MKRAPINPSLALAVSLLGLASLGLATMPALALTPPAMKVADNAGNVVTIDSTGNITLSAGCVCTTASSAVSAGSIAWSGTVGNFSVSNLLGRTKPALSPPLMDLSVASVGTGNAGGVLTISFTDVGFDGSGPAFINQLTTISAGTGSATYNSYVDNSNAAFGMGVLVGNITNTTSNSLVSGPGPSSQPFSMTQVEAITLGPNSSFNNDNSLGASPVPTLTVACSSSSAQAGLAYSSMVSATGGIAPYTYSIASGNLPPTFLLNSSTGVISGMAPSMGSYPFTVQVVDSSGNTGSNTVTSSCGISVSAPPPPSLNLTCSASTGQVTFPYNSSLTAVGGVSPYMFSISSGQLPAGLFLNASTGVITGTPTTAGPVSFTAKVTDSTKSTALATTAGCSIVVTAAPPPLSVACALGTSGTVGVAYSSSVIATGGVGPYKYALSSGSPPAGLTLNTATGAITGTPTASGSFGYTIQVTDSSGRTAANGGSCSRNFCSITIAPAPPLDVECAPGTSGKVGVPYTSTLTASGGVAPYSFSISSGFLPPGLTLNSSTGAITGTPTSAGTFTYSAKARDASGNSDTSGGSCSRNGCSITIAPVTPLDVECATGTTARVGAAYTSALTASGGVAPYIYSISSGSLPPGLTLNSSTGAITGAPTSAGTYTYTAKVRDASGNSDTSGGSCSRNGCSITIAPVTPLDVECATITTARVGTAYASALTASGGVAPYIYSISSGLLPPGLTLNRSTGAVTGTPTSAGTYTYTAKVRDASGNSDTSGGSCSRNGCSITVLPATPLDVECATVTTGQVGVNFTSALTASGGVAPYTFSISSGSLPPGLALNPSTGAITGSPTAAGTFSYTAKVRDASGNSDTSGGSCSRNGCYISVAPATPLTANCALGTGKLGAAYNSAVAVSGGIAPNAFTLTSGSLPPGLVLNASTGAITGTPTMAGTFTYSVRVVDSKGGVNTQGTCGSGCSITISGAMSVTCPSSSVTTGSWYQSGIGVTGGNGQYSYSITSGGLPWGMWMDSNSGSVSGFSWTAGTSNFGLRVSDSSGNSASASCSIATQSGGGSWW